MVKFNSIVALLAAALVYPAYGQPDMGGGDDMMMETAQLLEGAPETPLWTAQVESSGPPSGIPLEGMLKGNGAFLTPDERFVITTSLGGTVTAFDANTGEFMWDFQPPAVGNAAVTCHSNAVFTTPNAVTGEYMVYSIIDDEATNPMT